MLGIFGFSHAANVIIGELLSEETPDEAIWYAKRFTKIALISAGIIVVVIILTNPLIIQLFNNVSEETKTIFSRMMYIQVIIIIANFLNNIWIVGVFRAGGDNYFTMKIIIITTWFIALPLVFIGTYIFKLQVEIIYFLFGIEEISKAIIGYLRYRSNKRANNLVKDMAA
jgi:Na+-driven multidrug efflux pump